MCIIHIEIYRVSCIYRYAYLWIWIYTYVYCMNMNIYICVVQAQMSILSVYIVAIHFTVPALEYMCGIYIHINLYAYTDTYIHVYKHINTHVYYRSTHPYCRSHKCAAVWSLEFVTRNIRCVFNLFFNFLWYCQVTDFAHKNMCCGVIFGAWIMYAHKRQIWNVCVNRLNFCVLKVYLLTNYQKSPRQGYFYRIRATFAEYRALFSECNGVCIEHRAEKNRA